MLQEDNWDESILHVSDLSVVEEGCPRELWLRLRGAAKQVPSVGRMWRFRVAKEIHKDLTVLLRIGLPREWEIVGVEEPMEFDGVIGSADLVIRNTSNGDMLVVDYKSARGRSFHYQTYEHAKRSHIIQVQGYIYGLHVPKGGIVLYVDREGDNGFRQAEPIEPCTETVRRCVHDIKAIKELVDAPEILSPQIEIKDNKGPDSVKLRQPWQCDWCDYQYVTCHGALPKHHRDLGIVGHIVDDKFRPKKDAPPGVFATVSELLENTHVPF